MFKRLFSSQALQVDPQEDGEAPATTSASGVAPSSNIGASNWISITQEPGKAEPVMVVNDRVAAETLRPIGKATPVNMAAIFGSARGGKSFLMNQLSGQEGVFKISNAKDPCTQGVDLSRAVIPISQFSKPGGDHKAGAKGEMRVLLADVEGQGDRDVTYDARLASSILPLSKCVLFNWKDSLQVDRILNLLAVMQRAAHNIDTGREDEEEAGGPTKFGHLHIVFRDWNYTGTPEDVKKQLFGLDKRHMSPDVAQKNELRRTVKAAFASITVWLFPAPTTRTQDLSRQLSKADLSPPFLAQLKGLRAAMAKQLAEPTRFNGELITGPTLASLVPTFVDVLNSGEIIMPQSAYAQMLNQEAEALKARYLSQLDKILEMSKSACDGTPLPTAEVQAEVAEVTRELVRNFEKEARALGATAATVAKQCQELLEAGQKVSRALDNHNELALSRHLKAARKEARSLFDVQFAARARAALPMPPSEVSKLAATVRQQSEAKVQAVPRPQHGDGEVEEVLQALQEYFELVTAKVESENAAKLEDIRDQEEKALARAKTASSKFFEAGLIRLKSSGKPYPIEQIDQCHQDAHSAGWEALSRALPPATPPARAEELRARLQEHTESLRLVERSHYAGQVSASLMRAAMEEKRLLKRDTEQVVYSSLPLLPQQLEEAFRPILKQALDRATELITGWTVLEADRDRCFESIRADAEVVWCALVERNDRLTAQQELESAGAKQQAERRMLQAQLDLQRRAAEQERQKHEAMLAKAQGGEKAAQESEKAAQELLQEASEREARLMEMQAQKENAEREARQRELQALQEAAEREARLKELQEMQTDKGTDDEEFVDAMEMEDPEPAPLPSRTPAKRRKQDTKENEVEETPKRARAPSRRATVGHTPMKDPGALKEAREDAINQVRAHAEDRINKVKLHDEDEADGAPETAEQEKARKLREAKDRAKNWAAQQKSKQAATPSKAKAKR